MKSFIRNLAMKYQYPIHSCRSVRNSKRFFWALLIFCIITTCYVYNEVRRNYNYTCGSDFGYSKLKFDNLDNITYIPVNSHPYTYTILPKSVCNNSTEIYLLTVVKSAAGNFHKRRGIRQTWGQDSNSGNRKMIFILAYTEKIQQRVLAEAQQYNDIVQENFKDGYWSNPFKMEMAFTWITNYCKCARYAAFVDDDMYVNVPNALNYLRSIDSKKIKNLYSGYLVEKPFPTRDYSNKHYVSRSNYPFDCFPPYIPTGFVFFSKTVIQKIQKVMPYIPRFHEDDVYLGFIIQKVGVTPSKINFLIRLNDRSDKKFVPCLISDHGYTTIEMFQSAHTITHSKNLTVEMILDVCTQGDAIKDL